MKRGLIIIAVLFLPIAGMSQTKDRKAKEYYDAGVEKVSKKNFAAAIEDFSNALTLDSGFMQAYVNRGVAKFYSNDIRGAIEDYNKALKIKPDGYEALRYRSPFRDYPPAQTLSRRLDFSRRVQHDVSFLSKKNKMLLPNDGIGFAGPFHPEVI